MNLLFLIHTTWLLFVLQSNKNTGRWNGGGTSDPPGFGRSRDMFPLADLAVALSTCSVYRFRLSEDFDYEVACK